MKLFRSILPAALAAFTVLLSGCGPKEPAPMRIISARELLTADDCKAYFNAAFERSKEMFMGHSPPTLERDHVTVLDFEGEHGERVSLTLDQSVSIAESRKRVKDHRAAYEKDEKFSDVPGFGDSAGWQSGNGHRINFSRPPYRIAVQVSGVGGAGEDAKLEEAMRHFAKIVDERLKKFAPAQP